MHLLFIDLTTVDRMDPIYFIRIRCPFSYQREEQNGALQQPVK